MQSINKHFNSKIWQLSHHLPIITLNQRSFTSLHKNIQPLTANTTSLPTSNKRSFYTFVQQYQKAVTLTFGKLTSIKEPGFRLYLPIIQNMYKVDLRTNVFELPAQMIITKDNVSCSVTAVIYYKIIDAEKAVLRVTNVDHGIRHLAQTELRDLLCQKYFNEILENRDQFSKAITAKVEKRSGDWGVLVESVQLKNIDLTNDNMVRALAKEAEATREKTAAMIRADGEYRSAVKLAQAAEVLQADEIALQLRRLQTLERIAKEKSQTTLVVPMSIFMSVGVSDTGMDTETILDLEELEREMLMSDEMDLNEERGNLNEDGDVEEKSVEK